jgi:hypothetical protein
VYDVESTAKIENVVSNGNYYGFYIEEPLVQGYLLDHDTANRNSDDGFYIGQELDDPIALYQATLTHNTADNNGYYGFQAELPTKGKKNHAHGNPMRRCSRHGGNSLTHQLRFSRDIAYSRSPTALSASP